MLRVVTYVAAAAALAAIIAGCNNGCTNCVTVAPCSTPVGMQAALVYPAPGATSIPDNAPTIIVATNSTLPSDWQTGAGWDVLLAYAFTGAYGNGHYSNEFVNGEPAPLPSPTATPSFASPQYWQTSVGYATAPNLPPATSVTVELNDLNNNCYPGVAIGTFTTQ